MVWKLLVIIPLIWLHFHLNSVNAEIREQQPAWTIESEMRELLSSRTLIAGFTLLIPIVDPREIRRWQRRRKGLPEVPTRIHWAWIPAAIALLPCIIPVYFLGQLYYGIEGGIWISRDVFLWISNFSLGFYFGSLAVILMVLLYQSRRKNRCPDCGYNLTGITSRKCPECGCPTLSEGGGLM